jgi:tRNA ligase
MSAKKRLLEYMSLNAPRSEILNALERAFGGLAAEKAKFFRQLQTTRRVQASFHVTLIHRASAGQRPELWERYMRIWEAAGAAENKLGNCKFHLERVGLLNNSVDPLLCP